MYRVHEKPDVVKMEEFLIFLKSFGIALPGRNGALHPKDLKAVLDRVKGETYENVVNSVMLRSMQKAVYSTECRGHFACPQILLPLYFPHQAISGPDDTSSDQGVFIGKRQRKTEKAFFRKTEEVAKVASQTERQAIELERRVEKMKKAEYMSSHVSEEFEGIISGVTNFGIYVELPNTIEGMVRLDELEDDYYDYEREKYRVIGRRTKNIYSLGDKVKIRVKSVNLEDSEINFSLL